MIPAKRILLVEDNEQDVELTLSALEEYQLANEILVMRDAASALEFLRPADCSLRPAPLPAVIFLDLKMANMDGLDLLRSLKSDESLRQIPVVVLTSSRETQDVLRSYEFGVNAYVVKPVDIREFMSSIKQLGCFWARVNEPPPGSVPVRL
jgi:CheY-like chemotaxis protein